VALPFDITEGYEICIYENKKRWEDLDSQHHRDFLIRIFNAKPYTCPPILVASRTIVAGRAREVI
jgi:hypothetical protein